MKRALLLPALLVFAACEEEQIAAANPEIHLCPEADTPTAGCDLAFDLGERFIRTEHTIPLAIANRGRAPLSVESVEIDVDWIEVDFEPLTLNNGAAERLELRVTPPELGAVTATLTVTSDDPLRPAVELTLLVEGTPKPEPELELCFNGDCSAGAPRFDVDLGVVRRTQAVARELLVRNIGEVALEIDEVLIDDASTVADELSIEGSTRAGALPPGEEALLVVVYAPADSEADTLGLTFVSNDPVAPEIEVVFSGTAEPNLPPAAAAEELGTGAVSFGAVVGDTVTVDGAASSDPEGDPLLFTWTLEGPPGTESVVQDPGAGRALFVPDFAGTYAVSLVVTDSLGQTSEPASVTVEVVPEAALRVRLRWDAGGDVDLHLVPAGDALFGPTDCHFDNPRPDLGLAGDATDDPELRFDSEVAPGAEDVDFLFPADGTYEIYAQYFDPAAAGPAAVTVDVITFDQAPPLYTETVTLDVACRLWHVGDITFPAATFTPGSTTPTLLCAP